MDTRIQPGYHNQLLRKWQSKTALSPHNLMYPVFVSKRGSLKMEPIPSMPDQHRISLDYLIEFLMPLVAKGLQSILIFGVIQSDMKDETGSWADREDGIVCEAVRLCRKTFGTGLTIACDICLCPYTPHGHCGVMDSGQNGLDNERSIQRYGEIAVAYARAGADIVAPSDMQDNRVLAIKMALEKSGLLRQCAVMSYSAKFASVFYGPFRDACQSKPSSGDRKCYQLPPGSLGLARRAIIRDIKEGADIVMVKPGYPYLDVVRDAANELAKDYPIAVYQVSGEYSMLYQAGKCGIVSSLESAVMESVESYLRAGATIIITYFTPLLLDHLSKI